MTSVRSEVLKTYERAKLNRYNLLFVVFISLVPLALILPFWLFEIIYKTLWMLGLFFIVAVGARKFFARR